MASSRDDFIIAIRSAFLKKSTQQKFSLLTLVSISIIIIILSNFNFKAVKYLKIGISEIVYRSSFIVSIPENFIKNVDIPIQGGLHPEVLLTNKANLKKEVNKYLEIFRDHPYVFNLGHGILPETKIEMVEELVKIVRDFK